MSLTQWAVIDDFATLFQYCWYRDFPIDDKGSVGAKRTDWTIHIGIVVRMVGDLLGFVTRFERGGRKDAMLRSREGDEIAVEWEWGGSWEQELKKLKDPGRIWRVDPNAPKVLKYGVLITYGGETDSELKEDYKKAEGAWRHAPWPLLLILIRTKKSAKYSSGREFTEITMAKISGDSEPISLRSANAFPWNITATRWSI